MKLLSTTLLCFTLLSCNKVVKVEKTVTQREARTRLNAIQNNSYGYRKDTYPYDYVATGTDEKGNEVTGKLNLNGKLGEGKIYSSYEKRTIEVVVETALEKKKAIAIDIDGNQYFLDIK
ncbi:hypothetical protein [Flavobacterium sp. 7A]|uniref:hypothetical protein n=1 Tax=Flavobacterium sp. 7A TaxID=2940571 RepID=UPI0022270449|nr:hypothetical protein [Flavobacterium sp. 7A]MCW2121010.1 hypothetical protein [Flavobacterium sp. 7A]